MSTSCPNMNCMFRLQQGTQLNESPSIGWWHGSGDWMTYGPLEDSSSLNPVLVCRPSVWLSVRKRERKKGEMSSKITFDATSQIQNQCVPHISSYHKLDSPHHDKSIYEHKNPKRKYPKQLNKLVSLPKHPSLEHSNCCMCSFRNRTQITQRECEKECTVWELEMSRVKQWENKKIVSVWQNGRGFQTLFSVRVREEGIRRVRLRGRQN